MVRAAKKFPVPRIEHNPAREWDLAPYGLAPRDVPKEMRPLDRPDEAYVDLRELLRANTPPDWFREFDEQADARDWHWVKFLCKTHMVVGRKAIAAELGLRQFERLKKIPEAKEYLWRVGRVWIANVNNLGLFVEPSMRARARKTGGDVKRRDHRDPDYYHRISAQAAAARKKRAARRP